MDKQTFSFQLKFKSITSGLLIPYDPMGRDGIDTWGKAIDLMSRRIYSYNQGTVEIHADWQTARNHFKRSISFELLSPQEKLAYVKNVAQNSEDVFEINLDLTITKNTEKANGFSQINPSYSSEMFLHEFFLAMNLAAPGCCDFHDAIIVSNSSPSYPIDLHALFFENAWFDAISDNWPFITSMPLSKVLSWLYEFNIGSHQIAKTRTERALFALLHLCKYSKYSPDALIWIAHALEALYDSPQALITRSLQDRVCRVLNLPIEQQKTIRKSLRNFYDTRSSFVHGTMEIAHPFVDELSDLSTKKYITELIDVTHFGTRILVTTLQWYIANECKEVVFSETFTNVPL